MAKVEWGRRKKIEKGRRKIYGRMTELEEETSKQLGSVGMGKRIHKFLDVHKSEMAVRIVNYPLFLFTTASPVKNVGY